MDTLIKNGTVVTATGISKADVAIKDGKIAAIGAELEAEGGRVIDASACYVIPGGVDVHTHLDTPAFNATTADDFESGTRAAACGGTTPIVDFCQQPHGKSLAEALRIWHEKADGKASIDYGFHIIVSDMTELGCCRARPPAGTGDHEFQVSRSSVRSIRLDRPEPS